MYRYFPTTIPGIATNPVTYFLFPCHSKISFTIPATALALSTTLTPTGSSTVPTTPIIDTLISTSQAPHTGSGGLSPGAIGGIVGGVIAGIIAGAIIVFACFRYRSRPKIAQPITPVQAPDKSEYSGNLEHETPIPHSNAVPSGALRYLD